MYAEPGAVECGGRDGGQAALLVRSSVILFWVCLRLRVSGVCIFQGVGIVSEACKSRCLLLEVENDPVFCCPLGSVDNIHTVRSVPAEHVCVSCG